jgi:hypothetical protein
MVTKIHRDALKGDIGQLRELIEKSRGRDPLGEMTLLKRLKLLEAELAAMVDEPRTTANVALVFDGAPVRGSSAIEADFAGNALLDYQEMVAKYVASSEAGGMAGRGRLPADVSRQSRMNITSLVHGSFGFILEEDAADEPPLFESAAYKAVQQVTDLLNSVSSLDAEAFDNTLETLDARIFSTLKRFIGSLHKANATLRVAEDERDLKLDAVSVNRAYDRVSQVEVDEIDEIATGELLGLVPIQRRFEFRDGIDGRVISGRVAANLSAGYLERIEKEGFLAGKRWRATIRTKTVNHPDRRHSKVTNTLIGLIDLPDH